MGANVAQKITAAYSTSKQNSGNNTSNINQVGSWNRTHGSDGSTRAKQPLCRWRSGGEVVVQRSVSRPPSTRLPRQQSSVPRAECLSDASLFGAVGSQPADHFISHYRPLSDLTRFLQLYAALTYNMCVVFALMSGKTAQLPVTSGKSPRAAACALV